MSSVTTPLPQPQPDETPRAHYEMVFGCYTISAFGHSFDVFDDESTVKAILSALNTAYAAGARDERNRPHE